MSQQPFSSAALRGAVDLGALAAANQRRSGAAGAGGSAGSAAGGPAAGAVVVDVTEADFQSVVLEQSLTVPVVIDLWADWCGPCKQLSPVLERLAVEYAGRFLLAKVDVDANPQLGQAFQAQSIPMVVAVVKGQPVPLFTGALPEQEVRAYLEELLKLAEANGVAGRIAVTDSEAPDDGEAAVIEEVLPPLHQAAYDAIESNDLDAAVAAYEQALRESPADDLARIGLAQVSLMKRTDGLDPDAAVAAGDAAPDDVSAQLSAADVEFDAGRVEAAFARLVQAVRVTAGAEREEVRSRIVELFSLLGPDDPRVRQARIALTSALF